MVDLKSLRIPAELLPSDGRFGCGPSKVSQAALAALASEGAALMGTSHRQAPVRSLVGRVKSGLRELFRLPEGYEVVLGVGGATCFWDMATFGLIEERSQHLVFGEFSAKFAAAAAAPHLQAPLVVESEPGTHPELVVASGVDAFALTHNETSTGVAMEVRRPHEPGLVLVDATSAAGAMPVDPDQFDCYYFSPQKVFASDGGLWLAIMSPAALERVERLAKSRWTPAFLDLKIAVDNSRLDQTYNTPALATLFLFNHQLEWILAQGGLEFSAQRSRHSSDTVYRWAEARSWASPFVASSKMRSPVVATIDLDTAIDAKVVSQVLRQNGVVDTDAYRKLGRNQLRLGLFPAVLPEDAAAITACIDYVVERVAS